MKKILIAGGTGMIGSELTKLLLLKGYEVIILTRSVKQNRISIPGLSYAEWDVQKEIIDTAAINEADYVVHVAGAGIADKRWTPKRKKEISESRRKASELLINALKNPYNKVKAVVSASAIGWYGSDQQGKPSFIETDPAANDFLGQTCREWEESIKPVAALNKRLVILRSGVALGNEGGALVKFKMTLPFGIAPILGNGKQKVSWIHIEDLCRMFLFAIENDSLLGVYNAVAPNPVSNKELMLSLARTKNGRFFIPFYVPSFVIKLLYGELSIEVLKSATISCQKISDEGFEFLYPAIDEALKALS